MLAKTAPVEQETKPVKLGRLKPMLCFYMIRQHFTAPFKIVPTGREKGISIQDITLRSPMIEFRQLTLWYQKVKYSWSISFLFQDREKWKCLWKISVIYSKLCFKNDQPARFIFSLQNCYFRAICLSYNQIKGELCFKSRSKAQSAYKWFVNTSSYPKKH